MYDDDDLEDKRLTFLRDCKPQELRRLRKEKTLDEHLARKAKRCRSRAESLVKSGVFEGQAWQWAIREVLLETEAD